MSVIRMCAEVQPSRETASVPKISMEMKESSNPKALILWSLPTRVMATVAFFGICLIVGLLWDIALVLSFVIIAIWLPLAGQRAITAPISGFFGWMVIYINPFVWLVWKDRDIGKRVPKLPKNTVVMFNHLSYTDVFICCRVLFKKFGTDFGFNWVAKGSLMKLPVVGWGMYLAGVQCVDRSKCEPEERRLRAKKLVSNCVDRLKLGENLLAFPEGARSRTGKLNQFKDGMFIAAMEANSNILPIVLVGSEQAWRPNEKLLNPTTVTVIYGDLIEKVADKFSDLASLKLAVRQQMIRIAREYGHELLSSDELALSN
eukprot:82167_1